MTTRLDAAHRVLDPTKICSCVGTHVPGVTPEALNRHHVRPLSWHGPDVPANLVTVCATTHTNIHYVLNEVIRRGGQWPDKAWLRHVPRYAVQLARRAYDEQIAATGGIPLVYTTTHGEQHG